MCRRRYIMPAGLARRRGFLRAIVTAAGVASGNGTAAYIRSTRAANSLSEETCWLVVETNKKREG